jgi:hypothetical protein
MLPELFVDAIDESDRFLDLLRRIGRHSLQFSYMSPNDLNSPHSDDWTKLASMIAYFPTPGWKRYLAGNRIPARQERSDVPTMVRSNHEPCPRLVP